MLDRLIAAKRIPEVIGLFPDGTGAGRIGRGLWLDSYDGKSKLETFLVHDLVAWADRTYRTRPMPSMRGVIGLSDGATGGMNLIMRHPDVYGAVGGHSGDYILQPDWSSGPLFGPEPGASRLRELYSPLLHVADHAEILRRAVLYFDCGEQDESMAENRRLHAVLDSLHIAHEFHAFPGSHDWGYWRAHLEQSLIAVTSRMRAAAGADSLAAR
jgi:enterochelin esterase-like enzyme